MSGVFSARKLTEDEIESFRQQSAANSRKRSYEPDPKPVKAPKKGKK